MKVNNAPKRLYLSKTIYSTYLYQVPDPDDETVVEYTRTDAFIEKTVNWLINNTDITPTDIKNYRKAMKGE